MTKAGLNRDFHAVSIFAAIGVLSVMALVQLFGILPASAQGFHDYAYAYNSNANNYTGVAQVRYDSPDNIPGNTNCQTYYLNAIYQTQWALHGTNNWFELGTGHQCQGFEYWYAGYGYGGTWNPLKEQNITGSYQHTFYLYQTLSGGNLYWNYQIDNSLFATFPNGWQAGPIEAGLESYVNGVTANYQMSNLIYSSNLGGWASWFNTQTYVTPTSPMCAYIINATTVNVGEDVANPPQCD